MFCYFYIFGLHDLSLLHLLIPNFFFVISYRIFSYVITDGTQTDTTVPKSSFKEIKVDHLDYN